MKGEIFNLKDKMPPKQLLKQGKRTKQHAHYKNQFPTNMSVG